MPVRVLGMLSGTSADGVDIAVGNFTVVADAVRLDRVGETTMPWPPGLRERLRAALPPGTASAAELCRLDHDLGAAFGELAARAVAAIAPGGVDLVASHGQTIFHDVTADGNVHGTLQLGQPAEIAERLGVPVVADFRVRDVAAGGQGAPLVAVLDELLLAASGQPAGLLNLGGIVNMTVVRPGLPSLAFDCGPANALLDAAVRQITGAPYDADGMRTVQGSVDPRLLAALLADPYLAQPPPKSTGLERYNADYLAGVLARSAVPGLDDVLATLAEAVAVAVAADVARFGVRQVWASGGGVHNRGLVAALRRRLGGAGAVFAGADELGLPVDHKEAYAFALLGWLTWHGLPGSVASCTSAAGPRILGAITPGSLPPRLPEPLVSMPRRLIVRGHARERNMPSLPL